MIISIHDVSPATVEETTWWVDRMESLGIRATLLVIPGPWRGHAMTVDDPLSASLAVWASAGHEIALHGWTHVQTGARMPVSTLIARGAGEFASLDAGAAHARIAAGLAVLDCNGISTPGFTPPGWLISGPARTVLADLGFAYYTTHLGIHDLTRMRTIRVPVVCHRPGSPLASAGALAMRTGARAVRWRWIGRDIRVAIHPDDTKDRRLVATTLAVLESAVLAGVDVMPYVDYLGGAT